MNEEDQIADQKLIDAFNAGYLMQRFEPALMAKMFTGDNKQSEFVSAMQAGGKQHEQEKMREQQHKRDKIVAEQQRQAEKRLVQQKKAKR